MIEYTKFKCIKRETSQLKPQTKTERKRLEEASKCQILFCSITTEAKKSDGQKHEVKEKNHIK